MNPGPLDNHINALLTELSQHFVVSLNLSGHCKFLLYWSKVQNVKWCVKQSSLQKFLVAPLTWPAQSLDSLSDDQEVLGSIHTGGIFWLNLLFSSLPLLATLPTLYNLGKTQLTAIDWRIHWLLGAMVTRIPWNENIHTSNTFVTIAFVPCEWSIAVENDYCTKLTNSVHCT